MKFPFLASFLVFVIWLSYEIRKHKSLSEKANSAFWETEAKANSTPRKSIEDLDYVQIPLDQLPLDFSFDETVIYCEDQIRLLAQKRCLNLTGKSNTDLKLAYGPANLTNLMAYDQNFTILVRTLARLGEHLYNNGYKTEALQILEFGIDCRTDVRANYLILAQLYKEFNQSEKIYDLIEVAKTLDSLSKKIILRALEKELIL